ncbi:MULTISPECIES: hypothetical protein [Methanobrevibacter]|nr:MULTISPECIES: hypothetical protein [Methanobrevibacter]AGN16980.1 hypothetical protein Abm4_1095 [Methanobrevibacter sp. AbM4]MCI6774403.1 hypothetical protein [Methanobrevibacter boviskoreani]MDY5613871.1 hypothetical protein [Methanobrevibacter boviskoreani]
MIQYEINNINDLENVSEISEEIITGIVECMDSGETYSFKASRKSKNSDSEYAGIFHRFQNI